VHLDLKHLISISMDGPNVNLKFLNNLQQEHGELHRGRQLISAGSCGLHTVHNSFKTGFSTWNIEKLLRAMHFFFTMSLQEGKIIQNCMAHLFFHSYSVDTDGSKICLLQRESLKYGKAERICGSSL